MVLLILLVALLAVMKRHRASEASMEASMDDDVNPEYAAYEVHADPVAEVEDSNDYYSRGDAFGETSVRTQVRDNNSQYMFA